MIKWEALNNGGATSCLLSRAKIPGGWLVWIHQTDGEALTYYPDPNHKWDGNSNTN